MVQIQGSPCSTLGMIDRKGQVWEFVPNGHTFAVVESREVPPSRERTYNEHHGQWEESYDRGGTRHRALVLDLGHDRAEGHWTSIGGGPFDVVEGDTIELVEQRRNDRGEADWDDSKYWKRIVEPVG